MTASPYSTDRRRCVMPDGTPGGWQPSAIAALREAVRLAHGKDLDPLTQWGALTAAWRGLRDANWRIETERDHG